MTKKEFLKRCETIYEILEVAFDGKGVGEMTISICPHCLCMTKTIKGHCGKCGGKK